MSIHGSAVIDARAELDNDVDVGPYAVIDGPVRVHGGTRIGAHAVLMGWTEIGPKCAIHSFACVGDVPQDWAYAGARSFCQIGGGTVIREGATVHRGTAPESTTRVGERCLLMANAHVGHNCQIADDVVLVNGTLLAGHVSIGPRAFISGLAGIHQFVRIGELAMIGGLVKIGMDVPPFFTVDGNPEACTGVNVIGLRRAGLAPPEREELRAAYRLLYRSGRPFRAAVDELAGVVRTDPGRRLVEFLRADSKRGILAGSARFSSGRRACSAEDRPAAPGATYPHPPLDGREPFT